MAGLVSITGAVPAFNVAQVGDSSGRAAQEALALAQRGLEPGADIVKFEFEHPYYIEDFYAIAGGLGLNPKFLTRETLDAVLRSGGSSLAAELKKREAFRKAELGEKTIERPGLATDSLRGIGTAQKAGLGALGDHSKAQLVLALAQRGLEGIALGAARDAIEKFDGKYPGYMDWFRSECIRLKLNPNSASWANLRMAKFIETARRFGLDPATATTDDVRQAERNWRSLQGLPEGPSSLNKFGAETKTQRRVP
jgi:hypothetical protein